MVLQYPFLIMQDVNLARTTNMKEMFRTFGNSLTDFYKICRIPNIKDFYKGKGPFRGHLCPFFTKCTSFNAILGYDEKVTKNPYENLF